MTQITLESVKIMIADKPVDFRKEIDGLCQLVAEQLKDDPAEGIYVFYNKSKNKLKILGWHGSGFVLLYKRLETGKFKITHQGSAIKIDNKQLNWLLMGLDWELLSNWENKKFSVFF